MTDRGPRARRTDSTHRHPLPGGDVLFSSAHTLLDPVPGCGIIGRLALIVRTESTAMQRRQFLRSGLAAGAGLALSASGLPAIEPIRRNGKSHLRLSLAAYSFRKYLDLKIKPKPPMTLDDFVDLAAALDLDAVEPTAYYFADTSPAYLARLKGRCSRLGLDISGTAVGNDFCHPDANKLKGQIASVKEWAERAAMLGAKTVRIFSCTVQKSDTEEK